MSFSVSPIRADYRFMQKVVKSVLPGKIDVSPYVFDEINNVFFDQGGSWVKVFHGSPQEFNLLKDIIKDFFKKGKLVKSPDWDNNA